MSRRGTKKALEQHKVDFSTPFRIPDSELDELFFFARNLARRVDPPTSVSITLREKASTEASRLKGGQLRALADLAKTEMASLAQDMWGEDFAEEMPYGMGIEDWDLTILVDCALREASRLARSPPACRVVVIPELGCKARVATTGPAPLSLAGEALRKLVWPVLQADASLDILAESSRGEGLIAAFEMHEGEILYSADLERATDLVPHSAAKAVWDGVCCGLGFSETSEPVRIGRAILGPLELQYEDGTRIISKNGIPMGMSLSWFVLCVLQMYWIARSVSPDRLRLPAKIRGDDLLVAWSDEECDRYAQEVIFYGGSPHPKKSFRSTKGGTFAKITVRRRSKQLLRPRGEARRGLWEFFPPGFMERHWVRHDLEILQDVPVRFLIPKPTANRTAIDYLGPSASASLDWCRPRVERHVAYAILSANWQLGQVAKRFGLALLAPREAGGVGFPHPRGFSRGIRSLPTVLKQGLQARLATGKHKYDASRAWLPQLDRMAEDFLLQEARADERSVAARGALGKWIPIPRPQVVQRMGGQFGVWYRAFVLKKPVVTSKLVKPGSVRKWLRGFKAPKVPLRYLPKLDNWTRRQFLDRLTMADRYLYVNPERWEGAYNSLRVEVRPLEGSGEGELGNIATFVALSGRGLPLADFTVTVHQ